jgi:hypothetical protein
MPVLVHVLAVAIFAQGTSEFMLAGLLTDIAADLSVTPATAGSLTSAFAAGMVVGGPPRGGGAPPGGGGPGGGGVVGGPPPSDGGGAAEGPRLHFRFPRVGVSP